MREWTRIKPTVLGAPLFVHWTVFAVVAVLALTAFGNLFFGLLFVASYLAIIVVHELGHALVARRLGYAVDSIGIAALHGWCRCEAPEYEWDEVLIAWGGVAAQLVIALPVLLLILAFGGRDWGYLTPVFVFLGYLNAVLVVVNLIPGDASDGRKAWRIIPLLRERRR